MLQPAETWEEARWRRASAATRVSGAGVMSPNRSTVSRGRDLAPRLRSLEGKVGVLFDISKPHGVDFLDRVEEVLRRSCRVGQVLRARKRTFTKRAPEDLLATLSGEADFVILAFADCGSCTQCIEYEAGDELGSDLRTCGLSNCVGEALFFERRGIPTAVVGTAEYAVAARVQQAALGLPPYPIVTVRGSILRLLRDEVRALADEAMGAIVGRLMGTDQIAAAMRRVPAVGKESGTTNGD